FNSQRAIGIIFEVVTALNEERQKFATDADAASRGLAYVKFIHELLDRLGLDALMFEAGDDAGLTDSLVELLIETRKKAKEAKQYQLADHIRDELGNLGIRLQDHPTGTIWLK